MMNLFPGRSATWSAAEWCAADPGSLRARRPERSRISGAPLRAAPHPGNVRFVACVALIAALALPIAARSDEQIGHAQAVVAKNGMRSEEHTSELQSQFHLVC